MLVRIVAMLAWDEWVAAPRMDSLCSLLRILPPPPSWLHRICRLASGTPVVSMDAQTLLYCPSMWRLTNRVTFRLKVMNGHH